MQPRHHCTTQAADAPFGGEGTTRRTYSQDPRRQQHSGTSATCRPGNRCEGVMRPASNVGSPRLATHSSRANPTFDGQLENTASRADIVSSLPVVPPKNLRIRVTASSPGVMNTPYRVTSAHAPSPAIVNRAANSTRFLLACVVARTAMASVVRTGVVRAAQGACVGARTTRVAATAGQRRGMAGGVEFARSKVKKDFFVEVRGWPRVVCVSRAGVLVAILCVCVSTVLVWFVLCGTKHMQYG